MGVSCDLLPARTYIRSCRLVAITLKWTNIKSSLTVVKSSQAFNAISYVKNTSMMKPANLQTSYCRFDKIAAPRSFENHAYTKSSTEPLSYITIYLEQRVYHFLHCIWYQSLVLISCLNTLVSSSLPFCVSANKVELFSDPKVNPQLQRAPYCFSCIHIEAHQPSTEVMRVGCPIRSVFVWQKATFSPDLTACLCECKDKIVVRFISRVLASLSWTALDRIAVLCVDPSFTPGNRPLEIAEDIGIDHVAHFARQAKKRWSGLWAAQRRAKLCSDGGGYLAGRPISKSIAKIDSMVYLPRLPLECLLSPILRIIWSIFPRPCSNNHSSPIACHFCSSVAQEDFVSCLVIGLSVGVEVEEVGRGCLKGGSYENG